MQLMHLGLSIVMPGFGHVLAGRVSKGIVLWALFSALLAATLARVMVLGYDASSDWVYNLLILCAAAVWAHALVETVEFTYGLGPRPDAKLVDGLLRAGLVHYVRNEADAAVDRLRTAASLSRHDADVQLHLATIYRLQGQTRAARRALRRCEGFDHEGKWAHEVAALAKALDGRTAPSDSSPEP